MRGLRWTRASWRRTRAAITVRRLPRSIGPRSSVRSVPWPSILAALKAEAADEAGAADDSNGGGPESKRPRRCERKPPKVISPSDPQSAWTAKANKRVQFGYGLNYLIDIENAVIVDVEATPARTYDEVAATQIMLDRTQKCFGLKPKRL